MNKSFKYAESIVEGRVYYTSCYHLNALVRMAMHYVLQTILNHKDKIPLLSVRDVRMQIIAILKNDNVQIGKEITQMNIRHRQRGYDIIRRNAINNKGT